MRSNPVVRSWPGRLGHLVIGAAFALPGAFVIWRTVRLDASLTDTFAEVPAPLWRTVQLAVLVSITAAIVGTTLAWLTVRSDLPARRFWRIVLVLPLVLPSFVGAAAFIAGLAPGGVIHEALGMIGIDPPRRFRGLGAAWLVLSAFTYPYVLLPVSARIAGLRSSLEESGRLLGLSPLTSFVRVVLPQLRPAVLGGTLLAFLYTVSEFGAVQLLGFDTLTRVIYATRLSDRALSFACATVVLVLALGVITLERWQRGHATPDRRSSTDRLHTVRLGWRKLPATMFCMAVATIGLFVPIASLATWAQRGIADGRVGFRDLVGPAVGTAIVSVVAAAFAVAVVLPVAIASTRRPHLTSRVASVAVIGGFAVPGLVIALSLAALALATPILNRWYQTFALLIVAYVVHFGSQALSSAETATRAVPDAVRESSRLLEPRSWRRVWRVDAPLMRPGLVAGGGLVLLSTLKELPATLLLAPIGFSTLATKIWSSYGEGLYAATGLASLVLIAVSAVLTWALVLRHSTTVSS